MERDPLEWTLLDSARALRSGATTATALVEAAVRAADANDHTYGVFFARYADTASAAAAAADRRIAAGETLRPLDGLPIAVKAIAPDGQSSAAVQTAVPRHPWSGLREPGPAVRGLLDAGAVLTGAASTMEFAVGYPDPSKDLPIPMCSWDSNRYAGGSSSGSASGVSLGMFLGALGTDTGGSIRAPAACNGVTGMKPTRELVSRAGIVPLSRSLDHVGPIARSAYDCLVLLASMSEDDHLTAVADELLRGRKPNALSTDLTGLRIGFDRLDRTVPLGGDPLLNARLDDALAVLRSLGATVEEIELPLVPELTAASTLMLIAEAHALHRTTLAQHWHDYFLGTRIILGAGDAISSADYLDAVSVVEHGRSRYRDLFDRFDVVVTPTDHFGAAQFVADAAYDPLDEGALHTEFWNPLGNPTIAIPIGLGSDRTPLSMSVSGPLGGDLACVRIAGALQSATTHHLLVPPAPDPKRILR